jgi:predicted adenine nucleotide alpha hydrolase (AANH) superfamily ATPase
VVERLEKDFDITLFYYNPNITDPEEYERRLSTQNQFLRGYNENPDKAQFIDLIEGEYNTQDFYQVASGLEALPEGGARCVECFRLRLTHTADQAKAQGFQWFGTTLSVSPHKNHSIIRQIGNQLAEELGLHFVEDDFKKKAGYQRSVQLSKDYGLYRQTYCGCEFSK